MAERGYGSMAALSRDAGMNETGIKAILNGKSLHPRLDSVANIAKALGVSVRELTDDQSPLPDTNVRPAPEIAPPAFASMERDLQVWGSAEGGLDGAFELRPASSFDYVDLIRRPPGLAKLRKAFALYVVGESMSPWREPGEVLYINPSREAQIGNYVVVVLRGAEPDDSAAKRAMVKKLIGRTARYLELEQFNPAKTFEVARIEVTDVWRVMDQAEVLGFSP